MIKTLNAFHYRPVTICSEEDINFASLLASCMTVSRDLEILHLIVSLCSQAEAQNCLFGCPHSHASGQNDFLVLEISCCEIKPFFFVLSNQLKESR